MKSGEEDSCIYVFYCPKCGLDKEQYTVAPCPYCQTMMRRRNTFEIDMDEVYDALDADKITLSEFYTYIAGKYISQNPEFDQELYNKRIQQEETKRRISDEPRRCPRCGSSQLSVGSVGGWVIHPHLFCVKCGYDFGRLN